MTIRPTLAAALILLATPALANQCPGLIAEIDAAITEADLTDEQRAEVEALRDEGADLHAAGDHDASVEVLNEALALLAQ